MANTNEDPSPREIAERCAEIQATWTPDERLRRLRVDLRPQVRTADNRLVSVTAAAYDQHHQDFSMGPSDDLAL